MTEFKHPEKPEETAAEIEVANIIANARQLRAWRLPLRCIVDYSFTTKSKVNLTYPIQFFAEIKCRKMKYVDYSHFYLELPKASKAADIVLCTNKPVYIVFAFGFIERHPARKILFHQLNPNICEYAIGMDEIYYRDDKPYDNTPMIYIPKENCKILGA